MNTESIKTEIDSNKEQENNAFASGGKQTPLKPSERKTGSGTSMETRDGAEAEAPGARSNTPGAPNPGA